jgi:hypothetical protein
MRITSMVVVGLLIMLCVPGPSLAADEPDSILAKKIVLLEQRIKDLEERLRLLEIEVARLSAQLGVGPIQIPEVAGDWNQLAIGMKREEVRRLLGEPDEIAMHSYLEIWDYSITYRAPCSITFNEEGRVESWMAPR